MSLGERKQKILAIITEAYIRDGEPVGSKAIAEKLGNSLSSATIRNEMAELEKMELLTHPHTSAGRIPSPLGFRVYVDNIMRVQPLDPKYKRYIDSLFDNGGVDPTVLIEKAGSVLAELTKCVSVMTTPSTQEAGVRRIDIMSVSESLWAVVLITDEGSIKSMACRVTMNEPTAQAVRKLVNDHFIGIRLIDITTAFIQTKAAMMGEFIICVTPILSAIQRLSLEMTTNKLFLDGQRNLFTYGDFVVSPYDIMKFLSKKSELKSLLNSSNHINVLIGQESQIEEMAQLSAISTGYCAGDNLIGSIGIVGPMRMDYAAAVAHIEYFSSLLGKILLKEFGL